MTHLSQLGTQVREELENDDVFDVNEAGEETAMAKVKDFLFAPKYRSMQKKVNKMKMNALDIQITADNLSGKAGTPEAAKKETLQTKKKTIDAQIASLQTAVDDKAKDRGSYVQKVLKSEKIKGQMDLVKRASGQEDDPAKKKDLATSMAELQKRFEEEQAAVAALKDKAEPTPEEKAAAQEKEAKEKIAEQTKKLRDKRVELRDQGTEIAKSDNPEEAIKKWDLWIQAEQISLKIAELEEDDEDKKDAEEDIANYTEKKAEAEADLKSNSGEGDAEDPKITAIKDKIKEYEEGIDAIKAKEKKSKEDQDKIEMLTNALTAKKKELEKAQQTPQESLAHDAKELGLNEMAAEIESKLDWQFENNSTLARKYQTEIAKAKANKSLNESKYTNTSVADKFRQLLG
jgi:chromosome segregation ATPase